MDDDKEKQLRQNAVALMTLHAAKGLEFPVVFVSGLGSKLQLRDRSPASVLVHRDQGVGLRVIDLDRNIDYPSAASLRIVRAFKTPLDPRLK